MKTKDILLWALFSGLASGLAAQNPCDLIGITDVRYDAFSDTAILVQVANNSPEIFSYPGFILLDAEGDTLAREQVNFFGIGSSHIASLAVHPDAELPEGPFQGVVELWTGFFDELACTFDISADLCPDTVCHTLSFEFGNFGGALIVADYSFSITDDLGTVHASGTFTLEDTVQSFLDTLCLPSGNYDLTLSTGDNPTGGQPYCSLMEIRSSWWASTFQFYFDPSVSAMTRSFSLYGKCLEDVNAIRETEIEAPVHFTWMPDGVWAIASAGQIRSLALYDLSGRRISQVEGPAVSLRLSSLPLHGIYFVVARMEDGSMRSEKGIW